MNKLLLNELEFHLQTCKTSYELREAVRRYINLTNKHVNECSKCQAKDDQIKQLKTIISEGWKGKDELLFEKTDNIWIISEHRKDKDTFEVKSQRHEVLQEHIDYLWDIIKLSARVVGSYTSYRELVPHIIHKYGLEVDVNSFNGGNNRHNYFKYYYWPVKILEHLGNIEYGGRGSIKRLK